MNTSSMRFLSNRASASLKRPSSSLLLKRNTSFLSSSSSSSQMAAIASLSASSSEHWDSSFRSSASSSWRMAAFLSTAALSVAAIATASTTATTRCELQDPQFHHYFDESEDDDLDEENEAAVDEEEDEENDHAPLNNSIIFPTKRRCTHSNNTKGLHDPMTTYALYAMRREMEEERHMIEQHQQQLQLHHNTNVVSPSSSSSSIQATSSVAEPTLPVSSPPSSPSSSSPSSSSPSSLPTPSSPPLLTPESITEEEARIEEATRKAKQHSGGLKIFSGNGNMSLAMEICKYLGINLGKASVGRFADGECSVVINENVRGKDVYVIQPTGPPVNDNIMELLLMVSTLRRASARRITVVIPYYGYARQDRKMQARVPISAADVARLLEAMGVDRVIAVDLHCGQIQGFFGPRVPVDNLDGGIVGLDYFGCKDLHNPVIVSPDAGGVYRAKKFKEGLEHKYDMKDIGLAMIIKQRARAGSVDQMDLVGDVKDCDCIVVDDMIDTAGTLCKAAEVLKEKGARRVFAFASHGLLSGPGNERIANSEISEAVILNTIPTSPQRQANEKLTELSVAPLLAQAIFNIHAKKSISALFK